MKILMLFLLSLAFTCCGQKKSDKKEEPMKEEMEKATLGAGCFWCVEAIFQNLEGVDTVVSGYSGGVTENPTYKEISNGNTGHAEVVQVTYDPKIVSFEEILEVFFQTHNPTTLNRQGADVGTQYRSAIFYHNQHQKELAEKIKSELNKAKVYDEPIVTEITPFDKFYIAEDYHQNYFKNNPSQPYCSFVIQPKIEKFRKVFKEKIK